VSERVFLRSLEIAFGDSMAKTPEKVAEISNHEDFFFKNLKASRQDEEFF